MLLDLGLVRQADKANSRVFYYWWQTIDRPWLPTSFPKLQCNRLCSRKEKLNSVPSYPALPYIMYWVFDKHLKPCCCNGCSHSQTKKSACTALLGVHGRWFIYISTSLCAAWSCSVVYMWITQRCQGPPRTLIRFITYEYDYEHNEFNCY